MNKTRFEFLASLSVLPCADSEVVSICAKTQGNVGQQKQLEFYVNTTRNAVIKKWSHMQNKTKCIQADFLLLTRVQLD
jgi:hypothetical protein